MMYKPFHLIGLAGGVRMVRPVARGDVLCWDDVAIDMADPTVQLRREIEAAFVN